MKILVFIKNVIVEAAFEYRKVNLHSMDNDRRIQRFTYLYNSVRHQVFHSLNMSLPC